MTPDEVRKLPHGLYRIFWKGDDRTSLAAVGSDSEGKRWLAPCNWTGSGLATRPVVSVVVPVAVMNHWDDVEKVELILADGDEGQPGPDLPQ